MKNTQAKHDLLLPLSLLVAGILQLLLVAPAYVVGVKGLSHTHHLHLMLMLTAYSCAFLLISVITAMGLHLLRCEYPGAFAVALEALLLLPIYAAGVIGPTQSVPIGLTVSILYSIVFFATGAITAKGLRNLERPTSQP